MGWNRRWAGIAGELESPVSMSTSKQPPEPGARVREEAEADADAALVAARLKRQLLMGAALLLALASIYLGMLGAGRAVQIVLAAFAAACVVIGFRTGHVGNGPPS